MPYVELKSLNVWSLYSKTVKMCVCTCVCSLRMFQDFSYKGFIHFLLDLFLSVLLSYCHYRWDFVSLYLCYSLHIFIKDINFCILILSQNYFIEGSYFVVLSSVDSCWFVNFVIKISRKVLIYLLVLTALDNTFYINILSCWEIINFNKYYYQ